MFADILKNLRTSKNLSQEELGDIIGVSKSTIGMYEQGNRIPKADATLKNLAKFFNVSIDYLMGLSDEEQPLTIKISSNVKVTLSQHENIVINQYRAKPEMQPAVDKLLGVESEDNVISLDTLKQKPFIAAASGKKIDAEPLDIDTMIEIENMGKQ